MYYRARIPVSNAVTAMEVWLLACMMLVFLSLVEYTIILRRIVTHNRELERFKKETARQKLKDVSNGVSNYQSSNVTNIHDDDYYYYYSSSLRQLSFFKSRTEGLIRRPRSV